MRLQTTESIGVTDSELPNLVETFASDSILCHSHRQLPVLRVVLFWVQGIYDSMFDRLFCCCYFRLRFVFVYLHIIWLILICVT